MTNTRRGGLNPQTDLVPGGSKYRRGGKFARTPAGTRPRFSTNWATTVVIKKRSTICQIIEMRSTVALEVNQTSRERKNLIIGPKFESVPPCTTWDGFNKRLVLWFMSQDWNTLPLDRLWIISECYLWLFDLKRYGNGNVNSPLRGRVVSGKVNPNRLKEENKRQSSNIGMETCWSSPSSVRLLFQSYYFTGFSC